MEVEAENVRESAMQNAFLAVQQLAQSSQQKAVEYLQTRIQEIDEFLVNIDSNINVVPHGATLIVAFSVLFTSNLHINYQQCRHTTAASGSVLFQQIQTFDIKNCSESVYQGLKIYFPASENETPSLFPNFTPTAMEQLGTTALNLYDWLDATFSLLQINFD